uniref:N-acetylglucosaminylphosphatidylinositol deacetylase n=1 Tax=Globisporangium ultimum (strain ATCC 200006 / CBS 805.95 / DAOM BR144) TaxID=431595 RepID=K3XAK4_GLOUD
MEMAHDDAATYADDDGDFLDMLKLVLLGANALLFIATVIVFRSSSSPSARPSDAANSGDDAAVVVKHALLVTAHPDDESMFFLPLLHSLTQQQQRDTDTWQVHLLCLSRGNFDGLGDVREQEMRTCGAFLGMEPCNVHVVEDAKLQDGMQTQWDHAHIAKIVLEYVEQHAIHAVFTFDDYGVSGHVNHIAVHHGVQQAITEHHARCNSAETNDNPTAPVRGWALESTNIVRKYIGVLDAIVSAWATRPCCRGSATSDAAFVFLFKPWWNYHAMALHASQFVWYRRLFVVFSRYTFVNTLQPMGPVPLTTEEAKKTQ